jgi:hypothetical protein
MEAFGGGAGVADRGDLRFVANFDGFAEYY